MCDMLCRQEGEKNGLNIKEEIKEFIVMVIDGIS